MQDQTNYHGLSIHPLSVSRASQSQPRERTEGTPEFKGKKKVTECLFVLLLQAIRQKLKITALALLMAALIVQGSPYAFCH